MVDDHGHPSVDSDRHALTVALVLLVTFMVFEVGAASLIATSEPAMRSPSSSSRPW
jgi:uncharacterized membrane protein